MDAQAFRSPLAKFALALWMGCLHWPFTIPFVCTLPLLPRSSKARAQAWSMLMLFALGWTANSAQEALYLVLLSNPLAKHAADTWAISPSRNAGFGQIKSRPFAWQRMDGSTIRFNYGADTVHLGQWSRPAFIE